MCDERMRKGNGCCGEAWGCGFKVRCRPVGLATEARASGQIILGKEGWCWTSVKYTLDLCLLSFQKGTNHLIERKYNLRNHNFVA